MVFTSHNEWKLLRFLKSLELVDYNEDLDQEVRKATLTERS